MDTKAAFERAWKEKYGYELRWELALSGYRYKNENAAWLAWQASREAIEIDLPDLKDKQYYWLDGSFNQHKYERDAEKAITSHGIRIKGKTE